MDFSSLPGCIGYFGKPIKPNGPCGRCRFADICKKVVAKERLKPNIEVTNLRRTLMGGEESREERNPLTYKMQL